MTYDMTIYRGSKESNNPDFIITYQYKFEQNGEYPTVKRKKNGGYIISPSFSISLSEGFDRNRLFIPSSLYYPFISLFDKSVKLISDNLFILFPDISRMEFEVDPKALERFQTEKALTTAGMTGMPSTWVNKFNETFAALRISSKYGVITIPIEDAVAINELFKTFDPMVYSISMLRFFGKFDD